MLAPLPSGAAGMSIKVFLSTVSDEFRLYRDQLRSDLTRHDVEVKVQEDFKDFGGDTLDKLDRYIAHCDAVVHLVGEMTGSTPGAREQAALLRKYPGLTDDLPPLADALREGTDVSYTQWEAWLALFHKKRLLVAAAGETAPRDPRFAPTDVSRGAQAAYLARLKGVDRYPSYVFASADQLVKHIFSTAILDLLVVDYATEAAQARDVAEGFIREMAGKVAKDRNLDLDGMKQAVRNAIDLYEKEIAGGQTQTNIDVIVDNALAGAKAQVDAGRSGLARATLRHAAEAMRHEEEERRGRYVAGVTLLYSRERDIALAAYDGEAAAATVLALAEAVHGGNWEAAAGMLATQAAALHEYGRDRGSNVHLVAEISIWRELATGTASAEQCDAVLLNLSAALFTLGEREIETTRLEEAVVLLKLLLENHSCESASLSLAAIRNDLGNSLWRLGEREAGTARLEEAVTVFRAALAEYSRELAPLSWAAIQNNLGTALRALGEREGNAKRLEEAAIAYKAALKERTQKLAPLDWAATQNNLGVTLILLGDSEADTKRFEEAVGAFRLAQEEWTLERVPLDWAMMQNNLGVALASLGERERSIKRLLEALAPYQTAFEHWSRGDLSFEGPKIHASQPMSPQTQSSEGSGENRLEEAVTAYHAALEVRTRELTPLPWPMTQCNLANALRMLGERERGAVRLEAAAAAYRAALGELTRENTPYYWQVASKGLEQTLQLLEGRSS